MKTYDNIKMNTVFNGKFLPGDKRANKSIPREYFYFAPQEIMTSFIQPICENGTSYALLSLSLLRSKNSRNVMTG